MSHGQFVHAQTDCTIHLKTLDGKLVGARGRVVRCRHVVGRVHEIGVRKTLGATTREIVKMLLKDFGKPVLIANVDK